MVKIVIAIDHQGLCSNVSCRPGSHFGLCFWLDLAAKRLESRLKSNVMTRLDLEISWLKSATVTFTISLRYNTTPLQPCSPSDSASHAFNLSRHTGRDVCLPTFEKASFKNSFFISVRYKYYWFEWIISLFVYFQSKTAKFAFLTHPLGDLGAMYYTAHLTLVRKPVVFLHQSRYFGTDRCVASFPNEVGSKMVFRRRQNFALFDPL